MFKVVGEGVLNKYYVINKVTSFYDSRESFTMRADN